MKQFINGIQLMGILAQCILLIFVYGMAIRFFEISDYLEIEAFCRGCDGWGIAHLLFFTGLGYLDPNKHVYYGFIGITWELIETMLGQHKIMIAGTRLQLIGNTITDASGNIKYSDNVFWYGRVTDIAFNMIGYSLGHNLNVYQFGE